MKKEMELVKFNLTPNMSLELINFNNLKRELNIIKKKYEDTNEEKLLIKIKNLEAKLNESRDRFIKEFRLNNKEEIDKYLEIRKQNC